MNKVRILGLVLLIVGTIAKFTLENDMIDFISGGLVGGGIALLLNGQFKAR